MNPPVRDPVDQDEFLGMTLDLKRTFRRVAFRWYWIPLSIVACGLLGLLLSMLLPPIFRSTASLGIGIDYGRTHNLSPETEREALFLVQELMLSDESLEPVLAVAQTNSSSEGGFDSLTELRGRVRIERYEGRWDLSVASANPDLSAELTNVWAASVVDLLKSAVEAAVQVRDLQSEIFAVGCELQIDDDTGEAIWSCSQSAREGQREIAGQIAELIGQSHGIVPGLTFAQLRAAVPPAEPVARGRLGMMIGGLLIGFAVGVGFVFAPELSERE